MFSQINYTIPRPSDSCLNLRALACFTDRIRHQQRYNPDWGYLNIINLISAKLRLSTDDLVVRVSTISNIHRLHMVSLVFAHPSFHPLLQKITELCHGRSISAIRIYSFSAQVAHLRLSKQKSISSSGRSGGCSQRMIINFNLYCMKSTCLRYAKAGIYG